MRMKRPMVVIAGNRNLKLFCFVLFSKFFLQMIYRLMLNIIEIAVVFDFIKERWKQHLEIRDSSCKTM